MHQKRLFAFVVSLAALIILAACSQGDEDLVSAQPGEVIVQILAVPADVTSVTLEVSGPNAPQTLTDNNLGDGAEFVVPNLTLGGDYTFTARGLNAGIVLFKGSVSVTDLQADTVVPVIALDRLTSSVNVTATNAGPASEVVVATVGGVEQGLTLNANGDAVGTLVGVPTGSDLQLIVTSTDGSEVVRNGRSADFDLSEAAVDVSVALEQLGPGEVPPTKPALTASATEINEGDTFTLGVTVNDENGDLASIKIEWGVGTPTEQALSGGSFSDTFTSPVYTTAGADITYTYTVTITDTEGNASATSGQIRVIATPEPTDTDVTIIADEGKDLSLLTLTAQNVAASTDTVTATITPNGETVELTPAGGSDWSATLFVTEDTNYSVFFTATQGGTSVQSDTFACTVADGATSAACSGAFGGNNGGGDNGGDNDGDTTTPINAVDDQAANNTDATYFFTGNETKSLPVLANDAGDDIKIVSVTQPAGRNSTAISADGQTIIFTARNTQQILATFQYTIEDSRGNRDTATVTYNAVQAVEF